MKIRLLMALLPLLAQAAHAAPSNKKIDVVGVVGYEKESSSSCSDPQCPPEQSLYGTYLSGTTISPDQQLYLEPLKAKVSEVEKKKCIPFQNVCVKEGAKIKVTGILRSFDNGYSFIESISEIEVLSQP